VLIDVNASESSRGGDHHCLRDSLGWNRAILSETSHHREFHGFSHNYAEALAGALFFTLAEQETRPEYV